MDSPLCQQAEGGLPRYAIPGAMARASAQRTRLGLRGSSIGGGLLRYASIARVAKRLPINENEAIVLAANCAEAELVRLDIKGPPYRQLPGTAMLSEKGGCS